MDDADTIRPALERALGSSYGILRLLGRGGMGAVYLARDQSLERLVAIKVLPIDKGADAESHERFRREARTAARLMHPNIVPLHSFGEADGMPYLVMGYVRGESLSARMRREGRLPPAEVRRLLAQLAEALDHAHRQGVVHRDVKPDNVLIEDESGRAMLTDFGIAKALGAGLTVTRAGTVMGTPGYMSPEQAGGGETIDGRSDLYSLGVVAYALLAGLPPFQGTDARDVLMKHLTQEPPSLRALRPEVPEDLAAAVMRCLAKDPQARFEDARSFREAVAPLALDEDQLPEPLDALDGMGPALLPPAIVFAYGTLYWWLSRSQAGTLVPLLAVLSGGVLVYQAPWLVSTAALARRRGFSAAHVLGAFLRQPTWWHLFWFPRRLRRPGDVWDRLPLPFRYWRIAATGLVADGMAAGALLMVAAHAGFYVDSSAPAWPLRLLVLSEAAFLALALVAVVSLALGARHVFRLRLDPYLHRRVASALLSKPTCRRALWKRPELAAALLPGEPPGPAMRGEPVEPRDLVSAIAREAANLTGPARQAAEEAIGRARSLLAELDALDAEIVRLAGDSDPEEASRLRRRLETLGPESASEGEERRALRALLSQQAVLLAQVADRLDAARSRRADQVEQLRGLWRRALAGEATATRTAARQP